MTVYAQDTCELQWNYCVHRHRPTSHPLLVKAMNPGQKLLQMQKVGSKVSQNFSVQLPTWIVISSHYTSECNCTHKSLSAKSLWKHWEPQSPKSKGFWYQQTLDTTTSPWHPLDWWVSSWDCRTKENPMKVLLQGLARGSSRPLSSDMRVPLTCRP